MDIKSFLSNPAHIFFMLKRHGLLENLSDEAYVKFMYRAYMGEKLNLKTPRSFNEKLQWLKLYDHKPEYSDMVDKFEAKHYVEKLVGGVLV